MIARVDPAVEFVFEKATPDLKLIPGEEFSIRWRGSVIAEETGEYEFVVKTENGARLWVNDDAQAADRRVGQLRRRAARAQADDLPARRPGVSDPAGDVPLQGQDRVDRLLWKPPHGTLRTIPRDGTCRRRASPATLVVTTLFPPDDGSAGYERGTSVSKAWDQATTERGDRGGGARWSSSSID